MYIERPVKYDCDECGGLIPLKRRKHWARFCCDSCKQKFYYRSNEIVYPMHIKANKRIEHEYDLLTRQMKGEVVEEQTDMFPEIEIPEDPRDNRVRFKNFNSDNPQIYMRIVSLVEKEVLRGAKRISMKWVFEEMRRDPGIKSINCEYKVDNTFTRHYTELLIENHPEWKEYFHLKKS